MDKQNNTLAPESVASSESADVWEGRYQAGTTGWDRGKSSPALHYWLDTANITPCRILLPGCGNGYEALTLADAGFEVVAVDIAPSPVNTLKQLLADAKLSAEVIQADLLDWQPDKPFDAIYEQTCLCALNPELWTDYEAQLYGWLTEDGQMLTQFMQTHKDGGPPFHCDLDHMRELFPSSRWQWHDTGEQVTHPSVGLHEHLFRLVKQS